MTKVFIVIFLTITVSLSGATYYVSTDGRDSNPGTITQPFATWDYAFNKVVAGDIVYIRGGVYYPAAKPYQGVIYGGRVYNRNGTAANTIKIWAYQGEKPILDCSNLTQEGIHTGFLIDNCDHWNIKGLAIRNVKEYESGGSYPYTADGLALADCSNITVDQCSVYWCGNGFTLGGSNDNINYINCDSYENADHYDRGGLANGFNINIRSGDRIFFDGCRAWSNSDDGWDAYGGDGYITINNCWAFENGYWDGEYGNGAGFKTGKASGYKESGVQRTLTRCVAWENTAFGFDESQDNDGTSIQHTVYNCTSYNNLYGFNFGYSGSATDIIANNISYGEKIGTFVSSTVSNNSWQVANVSRDDFVTLDAGGAKGARGADGSLPALNFLHLVSGSDLIDAGANVGLAYSGNAPDIGAFEFPSGSTTTPLPVFISSVVENATPSLLEMTYDLTLNNLVVPSTSSFNVMVNSSSRSVNSVSISGNKVRLTLATVVKFGDVITVAYTKPANNPLQTTSKGEATSISARPVTNNCKDTSVPNAPPRSSYKK